MKKFTIFILFVFTLGCHRRPQVVVPSWTPVKQADGSYITNVKSDDELQKAKELIECPCVTQWDHSSYKLIPIKR